MSQQQKFKKQKGQIIGNEMSEDYYMNVLDNEIKHR